MSDPKRDRDSDRDSLTDWTLVDREGTPEDISNDGAQQEEDEDGAESTITPEGATAQGEDEEEEDDVEESEGGSEEEALSDDLVSLGQKVQEIKASLVIRYERISKKTPAFLVSVSNPHFSKGLPAMSLKSS
ncbi:hypothetical protein OTU49_009447 [Cherax quadricarinatus]|uniref:Uncharacterized protein n=1 Tax=Cherax quadricarinatus TaxID=27406 RepID=A0AAW0WB78_CHEQU